MLKWSTMLDLLRGAGMTVTVSCLAIAAGVPLGLLLALARTRRARGLRWLSAVYSSFVRAAPVVTFTMLIFFGLPASGCRSSRCRRSWQRPWCTGWPWRCSSLARGRSSARCGDDTGPYDAPAGRHLEGVAPVCAGARQHRVALRRLDAAVAAAGGAVRGTAHV